MGEGEVEKEGEERAEVRIEERIGGMEWFCVVSLAVDKLEMWMWTGLDWTGLAWFGVVQAQGSARAGQGKGQGSYFGVEEKGQEQEQDQTGQELVWLWVVWRVWRRKWSLSK